MIDLKQFHSLCPSQAPLIVSRDKGQGREHRAKNPGRNQVRHYQIDGVVIREMTEKCDFLLLNDTKRTAYLIELKGKHLLDAIKQLINTARLLEDSLLGFCINYRIVYRSNTHAIRSSEYARFRRSVGGLVRAQTDRIEETI